MTYLRATDISQKHQNTQHRMCSPDEPAEAKLCTESRLVPRDSPSPKRRTDTSRRDERDENTHVAARNDAR